jgi:hypothetical protein
VTVVADPGLVARGVATAGVGLGFALLVAAAGPTLRGSVDLDRFRFGSSVALGMLALSVLGVMPTEAPVALGVLCVTTVFSFDPKGSAAEGADAASDAADAPPESADDESGSTTFPVDEESRAPWL